MRCGFLHSVVGSIVGYSIVGMLLAASLTPAQGQFLSRNFRPLWTNEAFENYGSAGYRDYDLEDENRRFDFFGDLLIDGVDIIEYSEIRRNAPGIPGSFESRNARYDRFFDKLVIANEGFGSWSTRLIIGDHIRTHFTPMTLNLPRFNGIRWDGASKKSRFSLLATQLTDPVFVPSGVGIDQVFEERRIFGTSLMGGHWESSIGDILTLGTTYVNTHRFDAEASARTNGLRGTVPRVAAGGLRRVFVFFTDDEPDDGNPGARVYGLKARAGDDPVEPVRVGRIDHLLQQLSVTSDLTSTILLKPNELSFLRRNRAWLQAAVEASNRPFFLAVLDNIARDIGPATAQAPLQASGDDVIFYEYVVSDSAASLDFEAVVADDYSIDVVGAMQVPVLASGDNDQYYDWYNARRAQGQPRSQANLDRVDFRYGFPTGLTVMGLDFELDLLGFEVQGEYTRSVRFFQMPNLGGRRFKREADAFYVNLQRALGRKADVGFEAFDVPHDYTTQFSIFRQSGVGPTVGGRLYQPFELVEDNDDLDQWPDRLEHNDPLVPYPRAIGQGNGVFPGLDPDNDGVLDFDVDRAGGTDAFQPFLGYFSEPPELIYGDDFDNNGVADFRENDNLPDYAYPADHRGLHGFVNWRPAVRWRLRFGAHRVRQEALGYQNDADYAELFYDRDWPGLGYVRLRHRLKRVADGIPNNIYQISPTSLRPDRLENRDSVNNLSYFEWGLLPLPAVQMRNIVSYNHIDLDGRPLDDPLAVTPGSITHFSMVNKVDYTWTRGRLVVQPQFKHIYQYSKFPDRDIPDRQRRWIMPILRLDYRLGPRTVLKTGVQGLPLLGEKSADTANPEQDFRRTTYTAFILNKSNYLGYDLNILMGLFRTKQNFTNSSRPSFGTLEYFFRVFIG